MGDVTIYHNPSCGTSRSTLALIRGAGVEPTVVEYLKTPPSKGELRVLTASLEGGVRALLRQKEPIYRELVLDDPAKTDDELLDAIASHPILINRPVVVTPRGTRVCRPRRSCARSSPKPEAAAGIFSQRPESRRTCRGVAARTVMIGPAARLGALLRRRTFAFANRRGETAHLLKSGTRSDTA